MVDNKHAPPPPPPLHHEQAKADPSASPVKENYEVESKPLAPPGSRDYVAGQPVDEAEQKKVDEAAAAKVRAAAEAARQAEHKIPDTTSKR